ncbi:uncharacterized protein LOC133199696 [Saccostrea echinata]|uniref:uncharacterized protein LOC133199696 n=1 Tax=Saccostrea echinata TaxID=191078 RepID=UPI002A801016|nr:uncharacterized protein LOC133199696 [Saccostrea echinata]
MESTKVMQHFTAYYLFQSERCLCLNVLTSTEGSKSSQYCTIECNDTNKDVYVRDCGGISHYNVYRTTRTAEKYNNTDRCQRIKCSKRNGAFEGEYKSTICEIAYRKTCTDTNASFESRRNKETTGWKESLQSCKYSGAYLLGNLSINDTTGACQVINNIRGIPNSDIWIGITRQPVLVSDDMADNIEENVIQCQKCSNQRCSFTKECGGQAIAVCKQSQNSGEEILNDFSTVTLNAMDTTSEKSDIKSTEITSNQSDMDKDDIIITVTTISIILLILSLSGYCFIRKIIFGKKTHKALKSTRFYNKTYQEGDDKASGDDTIQGLQTDHYTSVEPFEAVSKEEYSEIGIYNHLRDKEQRKDQTGDLGFYNHLRDSKQKRDPNGGVYDCASTHESAASGHGNVDHIYDQSIRDVYGVTEPESGLEGDKYHIGPILTENTYDQTKVNSAEQDIDGEYSHPQDLQTEHTYGKVEVDTGALDDEYCHTEDIETEP